MADNNQKIWTISELRQWTTSYFAKAGIDSPQLDADILLADTLGVERIQLLISGSQELAAETLAQFKQRVIRRAKNREPIAYILGEKEFWSLKLKVTPATLIPRPDTECLVEAVLDAVKRMKQAPAAEIDDVSEHPEMNVTADAPEITREALPDERLTSYAEIWAAQDSIKEISDEQRERREAIPEVDEDGNPIATRDVLADIEPQEIVAVKENSEPESPAPEHSVNPDAIRIADIGTGTGAIALALASELGKSAQILAVDISLDALQVARDNAASLGLGDVRFAQSDLLNVINERFDIIVSNPPYVTEDEYAQVEPEVKREPKLALTAGAKGLDIYERLVPQAFTHLNPSGALAVEIGYKQGEDVKLLFEESGFRDVIIKPDYAGNPRIVMGWKR